MKTNEKFLPVTLVCLMLLVFAACKKKGDTPKEIPVEPTSNLPYNYKNSKLAAGKRFDAATVYTTSDLETVTGTYGSNKDYQGKNVTLDFTFIAPKKSIDTLAKRPFVMLMHGGGFLQGSYTSLEATARSFGVRGYAAATIEYRLGFNLGAIPCVMGDSLEVLKAVYRATQDANAAMRYFVKNADALGIDTAQIYLFGSSAGNVISTSMLYNSQAFYDSKLTNLQTTMGRLDNASNTISETFKIKGELSVTGYGLMDKTFINSTNARPAFYMQGSNDTTLPINYGPAFQCTLGNYGHTNGSNIASGILQKLKFPYEQYVADGAEHDISGTYDGVFYVSRMAAFIKRLWKGDYRQITYKDKVQTKNEKIQ